jgi:benzoyl-CoA reductase/2-hydroxyglutaryl-CoA dehydratase subunit BcrC/BadD/HgdB
MTEKSTNGKMIGYACAILPMSECPDQAGQLLHDNLCPHVKRILDRAISKDLPDLGGVVFMNSCDAMRRLSDAWRQVRSDDNVILLDLPAITDEAAVAFFAKELKRLKEALSKWSGRRNTDSDIEKSVELYNKVFGLFSELRDRLRRGTLKGGSTRMQVLYVEAMTQPIKQTVDCLQQEISEPESNSSEVNAVPVFLFGNVLADPQTMTLFESCGARIMEDDLCTGSRMFNPIQIDPNEELLIQIAHSLLTRPPCARTFDPAKPLQMAEDILSRAKAVGAKGVIGQTIKFCDPYLDRLPRVQETLREAGIPLLLLEGDCSLRSIEQQRTRIEAFVEMLD